MAGGSSPVPAPIEIRFCSQLRSVRPQLPIRPVRSLRTSRFSEGVQGGRAWSSYESSRTKCEGRTRAAGNREWRKEGARNLMVKNSSSAAHLRSGLTERKKNSSSTLLSVT
ncbi:hypothetical protein MUK42_35608 [Musa troglodytarum]|uniref:Uncharacterized protein n=1 Tax=Musa troglodytarum TaxID=320322 RepID=A0A9E7K987_9LILI|nr:hypothetical protein MUK42_35608 [Musa troglodytarum]